MSPVHLPVAEVLPVRLVANCRNVLGEGPIWNEDGRSASRVLRTRRSRACR